MAMAPPSSSGGGLEAKHYILAALTATIVAAAVVTTVSVVLSPAHLSFSVTEARSDFTSDPVRLSLTLAASNPSRRAAVWYQSIFVDVSNSSAWVNWMRADVSAAAAAALDQPRRNETTRVNATVSVVGLAVAQEFTRNKTNHNFSVMVTAEVRFRVGVAWTRLYDIRVTCGNVDFFASKRGGGTADCQPAA